MNKLTEWSTRRLFPFVLCYHEVPEELFRKHMIYLRRHFNLKFLNDLNADDRGCCAVTVDDCVRKEVRVSDKVSRELEIPVTLYLPVKACMNNECLYYDVVKHIILVRNSFRGYGKEFDTSTVYLKKRVVDQTSQLFYHSKKSDRELLTELDAMLKENDFDRSKIPPDLRVISALEVKELTSNPFLSVQSHSYSHPRLSRCSEKEIEYELWFSKEWIEDLTQKEVKSFCYPFGSMKLTGSKVIEMAPAYYQNATLFVSGVITTDEQKFVIPRIGIYPEDGLNTLQSKIYHYQNLTLLGLIHPENE